MRWLLGAVIAGAAVVALAPPANADVVAYLVNVHDRVGAKVGYAQLVDEVKRDFDTVDYYQGAYLINQAVNELCPAQIWQLRQSAAGYTLPA